MNLSKYANSYNQFSAIPKYTPLLNFFKFAVVKWIFNAYIDIHLVNEWRLVVTIFAFKLLKSLIPDSLLR